MFFKFGRKKSTKTQDDHAIINSGHEHKELLTDKEVLEYFAPYADLSALPTPSLAEVADYECHAQTDMVYSDEDQKEQEARILANKAAEEERLRLIKESEEEKKRRAEEAERKRKERERKKNIFLNSYNKGLDNLSGELFGSDDTKDLLDAGPVSSTYEADKAFTYESRQLVKEVMERIAKLRELGISVAVLEQLIHQEEKLSRLVITKDYDIYLPDYHNMEIKMAPLSKAVFFLFLRHPEGIIFKHLPDYHDELLGIYSQLKDGMISPAHRKSIDDITNPFNNSINEKCARIREAFVSKFDERLANHYCVDGPRGEAKKIDLPRDLVTWQ